MWPFEPERKEEELDINDAKVIRELRDRVADVEKRSTDNINIIRDLCPHDDWDYGEFYFHGGEFWNRACRLCGIKQSLGTKERFKEEEREQKIKDMKKEARDLGFELVVPEGKK